MWIRNNMEKDGNFDRNSFYEQLKLKHNIEKLNILYLENKKTYLTKMSRVRFHGIEALSKITNLVYSGNNWNNYDNELDVQININNISKKLNVVFDLVIVYKPHELKILKM